MACVESCQRTSTRANRGGIEDAFVALEGLRTVSNEIVPGGVPFHGEFYEMANKVG